ncbi:MAG: sialate O-acetylesterase [Chitinophagaceae bacterium]|nr:sialate O-acetylesterase [Chitinophagaceae bacterium]
MKFYWVFLVGLITCMICMSSCKADKVIQSDNNLEEIYPEQTKDKYWIFLLAGQSNMAGRAAVEAEDWNDNSHILTVNEQGDWIVAQEPLHFYEPAYAGLDCGLSFAQEVILEKPDSFHIVLIPCAVGGTTIEQWLGDSLCRGVKLLSNFKQQVKHAQSLGTIKGVLWHQGENNANQQGVQSYLSNLINLVDTFRNITKVKNLPLFIGTLGSFAKDAETQMYWNKLNEEMLKLVEQRKEVYVIQTAELTDKGDHLHFDSNSQRLLGKKFAHVVNLFVH